MPDRTYYVSLQSRGTIALPAELRQRHRLDEPGAQVRVIEREDGVIELHPQVPVPADQAWFWSKRWQAMERQADEDISGGRVRTFDSPEALFDELDE